MKKKGSKEKLKPLSFYGLDTRDVIRAIMQVSPERIKELEEQERLDDVVKEKIELECAISKNNSNHTNNSTMLRVIQTLALNNKK
jgi:hypothetical protein